MQSIPFSGTPYEVSPTYELDFVEKLKKIEDRVNTLRQAGTLTPQTLLNYYGEKRFEQVAESNAIEGSTLGVGETELAVLKGITVSGHDPAYVRDAISLNSALVRLVEIANDRSEPASITNLLELHKIILGDRREGGQFRSERVRISGSDHSPPKTWQEVMEQMEHWEKWSAMNKNAPAPFRAAILHAWLSHIHPFVDGNGRTARAIANLELVRSGYPPMIIRRRERDRYITSLSESDSGGDLSSFLDLILERTDGAITGLEISARKGQGYNSQVIKIRVSQNAQFEVWNRSVSLLSAMIELNLAKSMELIGGKVTKTDYPGVADIEDFITLCNGQSISKSWAFKIDLQVPALMGVELLSYIGHRSYDLRDHLRQDGPSIHWSVGKIGHIPKWQKAGSQSPYAIEITTHLGQGDNWVVINKKGQKLEHSTSDLAELISKDIIVSLSPTSLA